MDWSVVVWTGLAAAGITLFGTVALHIAGQRQDDRHRFTAEKRRAYSELMAIQIEQYNTVMEANLLRERLQREAAESHIPAILGILSKRNRRAVQANIEDIRQRNAILHDRIRESAAAVYLLGPENVRDQLSAVMDAGGDNPPTDPHFRAEFSKLVDIMRADLGIDKKVKKVVRNGGAVTWASGSISGRRASNGIEDSVTSEDD